MESLTTQADSITQRRTLREPCIQTSLQSPGITKKPAPPQRRIAGIQRILKTTAAVATTLLLMAIAVTAALGCSLPGIPEPTTTPRPTYTPYPTFTPPPQFHTAQPTEKPQFAFATAIPFPGGFDYLATPPVPPLTAAQPTTNPTLVPDTFVEMH